MTRLAGSIIAVCASLLLPAQTRAQTQTAAAWNLTTADFKTQRVTLQSFDERGVIVVVAGTSEPRTVPFEQFLELERAGGVSSPAPASGPFAAILTDGDRLSGAPVATSGETITWKSAALGESKVSMRNLRAIVRGNRVDGLAVEERRAEDVLTLVNGDSVRGVIGTVSADGVTIQPSGGGDESRVPLDALAAIEFAATPGPGSGPARGSASGAFRITLADGTTFTTPSPKVQSDRLLMGGNRDVALDGVAAIEHVNGPVEWLSSKTPTENVHTPYFDLGWPARFGRSVTGDPIRLGDRIVTHGIGVHAYSRLTFPIDATRKAFRTQFAIAGDHPYADATVRIKLDGQVVHETKSLRAGGASPVVVIPTSGAKSVTLEVDYGAGGDVQDRVNWIEPALLRDVPVTPSTVPTTQPN